MEGNVAVASNDTERNEVRRGAKPGRIALRAAEILAHHVGAGNGDMETTLLFEDFQDIDPNDIPALQHAIDRIRRGEPAGGGGPKPRKATSKDDRHGETEGRPTAWLTIPTDQIVADIITQTRAPLSWPTERHKSGSCERICRRHAEGGEAAACFGWTEEP